MDNSSNEQLISKVQVDSVIDLISNGQYQDALDASLNLTKKYPKESMIHNITGACFAGLGQLASAINSYDKAIKINPDYAKAHYNLGSAYHELHEFDNAIKSYQSSLIIDPSYADAHNNLGNVFRDNGDLNEAIQSYEKVLNINPEYFEAHYSLGLTFQELGQLNSMIEHLKKAVIIKPEEAEAHNRLGLGLEEIGEFNGAVVSFQKAVEINPNFSEAHNNLGNVLRELERLNEAVDSYKMALEINPDYPALHNNLGNTFIRMEQYDDAIKSHQTALLFNPGYYESLNNIGIAFFKQELMDKAIKYFKKAIAIKPDFEETYNNIGSAFYQDQQFEEAIKHYEKAIDLNPNYYQAYNNLGNLYNNLSNLDQAIKCYENALDVNSNFPEAHNNLGNVFKELGRKKDALKSYKEAIKTNPEFSEAFNNLGTLYNDLKQSNNALESFQKAIEINPNFSEVYHNIGKLYYDLEQFDSALESFERALTIKNDLEYVLGSILNAKMTSCNWIDLISLQNNILNKVNNKEKVVDPFSIFGLIDDPALQKKASEIRAKNAFPKNNLLPQIDLYPRHKKIRIGYCSADFREHPVAYLTAELYELHDRDHYEIHAFSYGPDTKDEMNLRIKAGVDHFHDVKSMSHEEVALLARSLEIDIAIDLGGFTSGARIDIFAMLAAPIQLGYLGFLGTMGAEYYDYLIADPVMIPKKNQKHFVEKIVYLPNFQVTDSTELPPDIHLTRHDVGLPAEGFVFCCFNNTWKITPNTFDSWARILKQVEGSVLIVYADNSSAETNLIKEMILRKVDSSRLIFGDRLKRDKYLARYRVADLFLDTQPCNAGTTAVDALRMELPVLTMRGDSFVSREAASILTSMNLPELITNTPEEYESLAIELATNPDKLKVIKEKLKNNLSTAPLYNTKLFTKNLESAYTQMYERYQKGLEPDHIYVE